MADWTCPFCESISNIELGQSGATTVCDRCGMESEASDNSPARPTPSPTPRTKTQICRIPVVGTETLSALNMVISEHKAVVFARRVYGINVIAEAIVGITDTTGGRSNRMETAIASIQRELWNEIQIQANRCGANAVVSFQCHIGNLSSGGSLMLYGVANGTPVVLTPRPANIKTE